MKDFIKISDMSIRYSKGTNWVLEGLNLSVQKGNLVFLLGANGSGKSTLLKAIANLIEIEQGRIEIEGKSLKSFAPNALAKKMALVLTNKMASGLWTVEDFVAYGRYPYTNWLGKLKAEDQQFIEQSIAACDLEELRKKKLSDLSDGERQRVVMARALSQDTDILVLDEPSAHLDIRNRRAGFKRLKRLCVQENKTAFCASHQLEDALEIADQLWIVDQGKVASYSIEEFNANPDLRKRLEGEG